MRVCTRLHMHAVILLLIVALKFAAKYHQLAMISRYVLTCVCVCASTIHTNTLLQEEYHCLTDII
ncbi:hypothetical protein LINJ_28_2590 [Leishmania infantum JPCM5]|uniref:Secreted protein n=1 Tax=Leishmania infantum TaxID=5671 RepID=E9AHG9_LEIIN|nr:hypothetical protein LINJ_28_2590 [Leishmania infantum JPCM5]CBZ08859.1 hypothetical protein LINJ_28_2590 [Leishmania infantum JPCM5]|eukprot:XP_003392678.1 hypothetical protein LINJ_28_2590 [Leishmania infantum JPCM5]